MLPFFDIETTGLNPNQNQILEIGFVIMTDDLKNVVAEQNWVLPLRDTYPYSDFILHMHGNNGSDLIRACNLQEERGTYIEDVLAETYAWLSHIFKDEKPPLCGSSVHFDRRFCENYNFMNLFSHRNIDVSSLKELCQRWTPEVFEKRPKGVAKHRALPDCHDTIAELRYYRENFLKF